MSEFLDTHRDNARDILHDTLPRLLSGSVTHAELLRICESHRIVGIVGFLLDADPDELHGRLFDAGRAYLFGLGSMTGDEVIVSRALPLLDALACRDDRGALDIARLLAPVPWRADREYDDDFLFMAWLAQWVREELAEGGRTTELKARIELLTALEAVANGAPRATLARALEDGDGQTFGTALEALLDAYQAHQRLLVARGAVSDEVAATLPYLCVEGLALLELAQRTGLRVALDHPAVPEFARARKAPPFSPNAWRTMR
jgi:hypothetical protein